MLLDTDRRLFILLLCVSISILVLPSASSAGTLEVTKNGSGISSIQEAVSQAESGDTLLVEPGLYEENVELDKDLNLTVHGDGSVRIKGKLDGKPVLRVGPSDVSVLIEGFTVEGAKGKLCEDLSKSVCPDGLLAAGKSSVRIKRSSLKSNEKTGARAIGSARVKIEDSEIEGNGRAGLWLTESADVDIDNVRISNHESGIYVDRTAGLRIADSEVHSSSVYGIDLFGRSRIVLESSQVSGNEEGGMRFESSSRGILRSSSITDNDGRGVLIQSSARVTMQGSALKGNAVGLTSHTDNLVALSDNEISENSIDLVGNLPGNLRKKTKPEEREEISLPNEDYSGLQDAVDALEPGGTIYIKENIKGHAVVDKSLNLEAGKDRAEINSEDGTIAPLLSLVRGAEVTTEGVKITGSGGSGIVLGGDARMTGHQTSLDENAEEGAGLWDSTELSLVQGKVKDNDGSGLRLVDSAHLKVSEGEISGNGVDNVLLAGSASAEVKSTSVTGSSGSGFEFTDSSSGILEDCKLSDNEEGGAELYSSSRVEVADSQITKNDNGISVQDASEITVTRNSFKGNNVGLKVASPEKFTGKISGNKNIFSDNDTDFKGVKNSIEKMLTE